MSKLHIADNLSLPLDVCTQTLVIFGKRGSGKSSTATRLAEQFAGRHVPFAVLDPPDAWWGLKSSRDGKSEGVKVYVFGGRHADLPLDASNGALLADVLVDHRVNVVMSLRHFSNLEKSRFVIDFAERLFQRNTEPLHLFCEEAHRLMPLDMREYGKKSRVEEMTGRMLKLITEGRTSGIGVSSITQRPASLHPTARNQSEILIAHRIIGPHDRAAIEDWIKYHREDEKKEEVLASLGELKTGDAWVWAPDFPEDHPIGLRRVHFHLPETFDSRRTPRAGERQLEPKALAPVDLEALRGKMADTIEKAKATDPKELQKQLSLAQKEIEKLKTDAGKLEAKLGVGGAKAGVGETQAGIGGTPGVVFARSYERGARDTIKVYGQQQAEVKRKLEKISRDAVRADSEFEKQLLLVTENLTLLAGKYNQTTGVSRAHAEALRELFEQPEAVAPVEQARTDVGRPTDLDRSRVEFYDQVDRHKATAAAGAATARAPAPEGGEVLDRLRRSFLIALAQHPAGLTKAQILLHSGYRASGDVSKAFAALGRAGWTMAEGNRVAITPAGLDALGDYDPLPVGRELREFLLTGDKLSKLDRALLQVICDEEGGEISKGEILERSGYKPSGDVSKSFARLVRFGYAVKADRGLKMAKELA